MTDLYLEMTAEHVKAGIKPHAQMVVIKAEPVFVFDMEAQLHPEDGSLIMSFGYDVVGRNQARLNIEGMCEPGRYALVKIGELDADLSN